MEKQQVDRVEHWKARYSRDRQERTFQLRLRASSYSTYWSARRDDLLRICTAYGSESGSWMYQDSHKCATIKVSVVRSRRNIRIIRNYKKKDVSSRDPSRQEKTLALHLNSAPWEGEENARWVHPGFCFHHFSYTHKTWLTGTVLDDWLWPIYWELCRDKFEVIYRKLIVLPLSASHSSSCLSAWGEGSIELLYN